MTKQYKRRRHENGEPIKCDACGYLAPTAEFDLPSSCADRDGRYNFCEICASAGPGRAFRYPEQYGADDVLRTVAWIGNRLLDSIYSGPRPDAVIRDLRLAWRSGEKPEDYPHLFED